MSVTVRCYEELNEHLPPERRRRAFEAPAAHGAPVAALLHALGVPLAEVDLILVDGESVAADHPLAPGQRVAVYPVFESFDVGALARLPARPLRDLRFVAEAGLAPLVERLRRRGLDAVEASGRRALYVSAAQSGRVLLTRRRRVLARSPSPRGCVLRSADPDGQLEEVITRFQLEGA